MDLAETLRGLAHRWYVVLPGLLLALVAGASAWMLVPPGFQREASILLLPGRATLPESSSNPYLFLGGLTNAADVVVRVVGSEGSLGDLMENDPDLEVEVVRDTSTSGPIILIRVTARTDIHAEAVLREIVERTSAAVDRLQADAGVNPDDRLTVKTIAIDESSILQQRMRIVLAGGAAGGLAVLTLFVASAVHGARAPRGRGDSHDVKPPELPQEPEGEGMVNGDTATTGVSTKQTATQNRSRQGS